jgi:hypothetical protein
VQRVEATNPRWLGEEPLWVVAPRVPAVLSKMRSVERVGRSCYRVGSDFPFLWIAANELPLLEELIPFLIARSGRSMLHFLQWVAPRRPTPRFLGTLSYLPISPNLREELLRYFPQTEDPEMMERQRHITEARSALRQVLERRGLSLTPQQSAQIEACSDLPTLEHWLDEAILAPTAAALR